MARSIAAGFLLITVFILWGSIIDVFGRHPVIISQVITDIIVRSSDLPNSNECNNHNNDEWVAVLGNRKISVAVPDKALGWTFHVRTCDQAIQPDQMQQISNSPEGTNTTHYSVQDRDGNAVAVTYTINSFFGAGVIAENTGFFLNNEIDDFTLQPGIANQFGLVQGQRNAIAPGK
jgi:Gamma-glutamyltranspeptidase